MKLWVQTANQTIKELQWRWLTEEDLPAIRDLEDRVEKALEDPTLYRRDPEEEIRQSIQEGAGCVGGFVKKELVALRYIMYPGIKHLAEGIIGEEHYPGVLHMESMVVDPNYRGNGLQLKSFYYMLAFLPKEIRFLFSTVSPYNLPSLKSVFRYGSVMLDLRYMYPDAEHPEGVLRYIAARGLVQEWDKQIEIVRREDVDRQQALFSRGYCATGLTPEEQIKFQRIIRTEVPLLGRNSQ